MKRAHYSLKELGDAGEEEVSRYLQGVGLAVAWMTLSHRWGQDYRIDAVGVWINSTGSFELEHRKAVL